MRKMFLPILLATTLIGLGSIGYGVKGAESNSKWVRFAPSAQVSGTYDYIYVVGGYHSIDDGCPAWGTANVSQARFIGDSMGDIVITYKDGTQDKIPLVFGYTMWYYSMWQKTDMPFKGEGADPDLKALLQSTLHLQGGYEGQDTGVLRIKVQNKPISEIRIADNPKKDGNPVFHGAYLVSGDPGNIKGGNIDVNTEDSFYGSHTIDSTDSYPDSVKNNIASLAKALMTYEEDFQNAPEFSYPAGYEGSRVYFTGGSIPEIANGVVYYNLENLINRTDEDGFIHTSYKGSGCWEYWGFGTWKQGAGTFYDSYYSRDGARAIMSLNTYGQLAKADTAVKKANSYIMYWPENNLKLKGVDIPGHYTVVINKPLVYSTELVPAGWGTRYTKAKFGDDYQNLGNQETDGHGLMMLANYNVWQNQGATSQWVNDNWTYINEAARWILWCFEHTDLSFSTRGLLYGESEGGMMEYTLYNNIPCCLGMYAYSEMAESAGKTAEAEKWRACADELAAAINNRLTRGSTNKKWDTSNFGFFHDPVITMMSDYYGYDLNDMNQEWVSNSRNTYQDDIKGIAEVGYFGASGLGYNHSMITQSALLLDQMSDATKLMENLCKLCYAPRLPEPYLVPEGSTADAEAGVIRRQGDLGNLVQLSEALKCYAITIGISPVNNNTLKLMPRLPEGWGLDIQEYDIPHANGTVDLLVSYPASGVQTAQVTLNETSGFDETRFRFGPLPADTLVAKAQINGSDVECSLEQSGDSMWAWVTLEPSQAEQKVALVYGTSSDNLPGWPDNWLSAKPKPDSNPAIDNINNKKSGIGMLVGTIGAIVAAVACVAVAGVVIVKKRK